MWTITEPFLNREFLRVEVKNFHTLRIFVFFVVLRYGRPCQEMCGVILWVSKQDDSTTLQSAHSMHRWPPLQRRNEICWRNATSLLKLFWNAEIWHGLGDLIVHGQWTNLLESIGILLSSHLTRFTNASNLTEWSKIWIMLTVLSFRRPIRASRSFVVCVWGQRSSEQDDKKGRRSPTMRHVSRTHRVALDWLFDRINLDSKIQIKYIDTTKNNSQTYWPKGNFTRDEWNSLLCLFHIGHFSSTVCSEALAKRVQQDSGEERVTAKSRPMMRLVARAPSNLSSSASESLRKKSNGNQSPWSAKAEKEDRTGQPVVGSDPRTVSG